LASRPVSIQSKAMLRSIIKDEVLSENVLCAAAMPARLIAQTDSQPCSMAISTTGLAAPSSRCASRWRRISFVARGQVQWVG
jgi:hypothetical protein